MLDPAVETVVRQVVSDKTQAGDMFTAFDVSLDVKSKGHRERHNNMKHVVHEEFSSGNMLGYTRTLIPIPGTVDAWLYHRLGDDPSTYTPRSRTQPTTPTATSTPMGVQDFYKLGPATQADDSGTTVVPNPPSGLVAVPTASSAYARTGDARGSVCVPADLLKKVGVNPADKVYVYAGSNCALVDKNTKSKHEYTVDVNNNVRITRHALKACGVKDGRYDFEIVGGQVVVRSVP